MDSNEKAKKFSYSEIKLPVIRDKTQNLLKAISSPTSLDKKNLKTIFSSLTPSEKEYGKND